MSSNKLSFPGVRSSLVFSGFGFQSYSYSNLKTSPSVTSKVVPSVCFSFFCLLASLVSNFHPDTRVGVVVHFFRLTCSVMLWGGRNTANIHHWRVWGVLAVSQAHWVCPCSGRVCPPCPHCSGSRLLHREPSKASPGLHAPPRSKPFRFRHSGSPQRRRLSWACILCPSQVQAAQVMRCLASPVAATYRFPRPCRSVFWVYNQRTFSGGC